MIVIRPAPGEPERVPGTLDLTQSEARAMGVYLHGQVMDRFRRQGAPDAAWKPKRFPDGRSILTGATGDLKRSFVQRVEQHGDIMRVSVESDSGHSVVHQLGTVGKGGVLPDIKPKRAKALFIPLTPAARNSQRVGEKRVAVIRTGARKLEAMAAKGLQLTPTSFKQLKPGKIVDGRAVRSDGKAGNPDFIFLRKVSIPPRPMLPDSQQEQLAQGEELADLIARG